MSQKFAYIASTALAAGALLGGAIPAQAQQVLTVAGAASLCPVSLQTQVGQCDRVVQAFLASRTPGAARDADIVQLALSIAQAGNGSVVPQPICIEAADAVVTLAIAMDVDAAAQLQLLEIAAAMCIDQIPVAAIGSSNDDDDDDDDDDERNRNRDDDNTSNGGGIRRFNSTDL